MPSRETETNRIIVFRNSLSNHFLNGLAKGMRIVFDLGQAAHNEAFQMGEFSSAFQSAHHPVNMVYIFVNFFNEEYFSICFGKNVGAIHAH